MSDHKEKNSEHFDEQAKTWDEKPQLVEMANSIAAKLAEKVELEGKEVLDLGAGTGLVAQQLADKAKQVVGVDLSSEMIKGFNAKREKHPNMVGICVDISDEDAFSSAVKDQKLPETFDLAYIHLTLHHIEDMEGTVKRLAALTKPGGKVAISDILKTENSDLFHGPKKGKAPHQTVAHGGGFEPSLITEVMEQAGLANVDITPNAASMLREFEQEDGEKVSHKHPIFLAIAQKQ